MKEDKRYGELSDEELKDITLTINEFETLFVIATGRGSNQSGRLFVSDEPVSPGTEKEKEYCEALWLAQLIDSLGLSTKKAYLINDNGKRYIELFLEAHYIELFLEERFEKEVDDGNDTKLGD